MKLNEFAMLSSVTISYWQAARTDKKISDEIAKKHDVLSSVGHYRKYAINIKDEKYQAVVTAAGDLRTTHHYYTMPWANDGARILTAAMFETYSKAMREKRAAFDAAVAALLPEMPRLKDEARKALNGMFNDADYPTDMKRKFGVSQSIMPLPDADDFRTKLPTSAVKDIKANIQSEVMDGLQRAAHEPFERLYDAITKIAAKLADPKGIFRDTLITNLADLCQVLPGLNLMNDPRLDDLRRKAEELVADIDPQDLRETPKTRKKVAVKAREIQDAMAGFMGVSQ